MPNKFSIGDKVVIRRDNPRTPKHILTTFRLDHPRTITSVFYDHKTQHTRYYLGINKRGSDILERYAFRASQLKLWIKGKIGRPKTKRRYKFHSVLSRGVTS